MSEFTIPAAGRSPTSRSPFRLRTKRGRKGACRCFLTCFLRPQLRGWRRFGNEGRGAHGVGELHRANDCFVDGLRRCKPSGNVASRRWHMGLRGIFRPHGPTHVALLMHGRAGYPKRYSGLARPWSHDQQPCPQAGRLGPPAHPLNMVGVDFLRATNPLMMTNGRRPSSRCSPTPTAPRGHL